MSNKGLYFFQDGIQNKGRQPYADDPRNLFYTGR